MKKNESKNTSEMVENNILVGYVRRSNAGGALKRPRLLEQPIHSFFMIF